MFIRRSKFTLLLRWFEKKQNFTSKSRWLNSRCQGWEQLVSGHHSTKL